MSGSNWVGDGDGDGDDDDDGGGGGGGGDDDAHGQTLLHRMNTVVTRWVEVHIS